MINTDISAFSRILLFVYLCSIFGGRKAEDLAQGDDNLPVGRRTSCFR